VALSSASSAWLGAQIPLTAAASQVAALVPFEIVDICLRPDPAAGAAASTRVPARPMSRSSTRSRVSGSAGDAQGLKPITAVSRWLEKKAAK
jgi:hypothetical protein